MRQLLWVVALAACDKGATTPPATCKEVVTKARGTFDMRLERAEKLVGVCELSNWNATIKTCVANAKSSGDVDTCIEGPGDLTRSATALKKMAEFKDQMCACKDTACAQRVSDVMTSWAQELSKEQTEPPKMTEEDTKKATEIGEEMGKCMQKAMGAG
jgi:hypothetical protein